MRRVPVPFGTLPVEKRFFSGLKIHREPKMKNVHVIALAAATVLGLGSAVAVAQTVSGGNPYEQGYAAGASATEQNSFNAFDGGYRAGETAQSNAESQTASAQAYNKGYEAGIAQANRDREQAYNEGYENRAQQDQSVTARAFDNGFDAGAYRQARNDAEYP
jgi:hypothetical protein